MHHAAPASPPGNPNNNGYIFADFDPNDSSGKYIPDNDADTYKTPIVQQQSLGHTRGPVPTPRVNPLMTLASVVGASPPGYTNDSSGQSIAFDVIGDSGAPSQLKLEGYETKVTDLLSRDAAASRPAFLFHVGDVVYFYGEQDYYGQFYEPLRAYPAPIFAIPGNRDGVIYSASMVSLDAFQHAFAPSTRPLDRVGRHPAQRDDPAGRLLRWRRRWFRSSSTAIAASHWAGSMSNSWRTSTRTRAPQGAAPKRLAGGDPGHPPFPRWFPGRRTR